MKLNKLVNSVNNITREICGVSNGYISEESRSKARKRRKKIKTTKKK